MRVINAGGGDLVPEYNAKCMKESIFGRIDVFLALTAAVVCIWRIGVKYGR